jgi:hypothetical protein
LGSVRVGSGTGSVVEGNGSFNVGNGTTVVLVGNGNGKPPPPWDFVGWAADVLAGGGAPAGFPPAAALVVDAGLAGAALRFAEVDVRAGRGCACAAAGSPPPPLLCTGTVAFGSGAGTGG